MPTTLDWKAIALRLFLTVIAGAVIGFNRGEHGRPAGLRTTLLVSLAACIAMIQANLLMNTTGKTSDSFVVLDLMRLPLGILSGIGFIGAGAILRRGNIVLGVTTAATLWFVTVMGLCFGGGQIGLGIAAFALGITVLGALKWVDERMPQDHHGRIFLLLADPAFDEESIRSRVEASGFRIRSFSLKHSLREKTRALEIEVYWSAPSQQPKLPSILKEFAQFPGVLRIEWKQ